MMINLENELVQNKRVELSKWDRFTIEKVEKYNAIDGVEVLDRLGMYKSNKEEAEVIKAKATNILNYNPERVFSADDVQRLCIRYGLRCLPAEMFNGEIDAELPKKILDFEKNYVELDPPNWTKFRVINGKTRMVQGYICAPASSFALEARPKDPLFFVRVEYGHAVNFILLHKWGNDISPWRLVANLWRRTFLSILATILFTLSAGAYAFSFKYGDDAWLVSFVIFMIFIFTLIIFVSCFGKTCISNRCKWNERFE